jgi:hypothetical protein
MVGVRWAIQEAADTGRFHPTFYREVGWPGFGAGTVREDAPRRYKSGGHHTEGFATLDEAKQYLHDANEVNLDDVLVLEGDILVVDVAEAGADVLVMPA